MATTTRWVRYVVPVMVGIDCDNDELTRVVVLPGEAREDRDDLGHFCIYDENFVRRHADGQPETHALWVANPPDGRILPGPPQHWPPMREWEDGFDITPDTDDLCEEDRYTDIHPYHEPRRSGRR